MVLLITALLSSGNGVADESLRDLPRDAAGVGSGDVQGVQSLGDGERGAYSIPVHGLAGDGTPIPPTATPGTPEPIVIVPVATVVPICEWECILRTVGWPEYEIPAALSVSWCESRHQDVQNYGGGPYYGRFQVGIQWHRDKLIARGYPPTSESLLNPWINAEIALMIWQQTRWQEWECKP